MLFYSFFKTLVGKEVAVELKNDVVLIGTLVSVDQYLNAKLKSVKVVNADKHPQLGCIKNCFIRGSAIRFVWFFYHDWFPPLLPSHVPLLNILLISFHSRFLTHSRIHLLLILIHADLHATRSTFSIYFWCMSPLNAFRYIQLPAAEVDTELLQDAARKDNAGGR
jgi:U6 snRNA-associated Sm-like protein LSm2